MKKSGGREDGSPAFDRRSRCDRFFALNRRRHRREICRQQRERPRPMLEQPPRRERGGGDPAKLAWRKRSRARKPKQSGYSISLSIPTTYTFFLQNRKSCDEGEREREREGEAKEANWRRQLQLQTTAKGPSPDPPRSPRSRGVKFLPIPDLSRRRVSPSLSVPAIVTLQAVSRRWQKGENKEQSLSDRGRG